MARPPYLRWFAASLILLVGIAIEMGGQTTAPYPFLAATAPAGTPIVDLDIDWRDVPAGLLDPPDLTWGLLAVDLAAGAPLIHDAVHRDRGAPEDWWAVPLPLPATVVPGAEVLVIITTTGDSVPGMVVAGAAEGGFGIAEPGLVAVPPEFVTQVGGAAAVGDVLVATRP